MELKWAKRSAGNRGVGKEGMIALGRDGVGVRFRHQD